MIINKSVLTSVFTGFNAKFFKAIDETKTFHETLSTVVPSKTKTEDYAWLQQVPTLKEWLNGKDVKNIASSNYSIVNRRWESTIEVDRDDILDDNVGMYDPIISMLGDAAAQHPGILLSELMALGFTTTCYDGQYFFDTDHPNGLGGTWSNKGTAAFDSGGVAYAAARKSMMTRTGEEGRYLNTSGNLLVGPPSLETNFRTVLVDERKASGATNTWKGTADYMIIPELEASPTKWYLLDVTKPLKPFILQMREAIHPVSMTNPSSQIVFDEGKYKYGAEARYNVGYGLPHIAYGSDGTT